jgi:hypothetical protein
MRRLTRIWHDLEAEQQWKYWALPPCHLFEMLKLNLLYADESELARAAWFWLRRPKTPLPKSLLYILLCVAATPCLFMHMIGFLLFFAWCFGILIAAIDDEVRLIHWRREYENSIDRLKFVSSQRRTDRKKHGALHISCTSCGIKP